MSDTASRRELSFEDFDAVIRDIRELRDGGYRQLGQWNLAQICGHLNDWLRFPMDGFPVPALMRPILWFMKVTKGKKQVKRLMETNSMPAKLPTMPSTIPTSTVEEEQELEKLKDTMSRFLAYDRSFHPSPVFGELDRATLLKLNLIHMAHHLSFLVPESASESGAT